MFSLWLLSGYSDEQEISCPEPKAFFHLPSDCRALSAMKDATQYGLDQMPAIDASIASLIVAPDEALRTVGSQMISIPMKPYLWHRSSDGTYGEFIHSQRMSQIIQTMGADPQTQLPFVSGMQEDILHVVSHSRPDVWASSATSPRVQWWTGASSSLLNYARMLA